MSIREARDIFEKNLKEFKGEKVPFEQGKQRREICNNCEENILNICSKCLCSLRIKPYFKSHILQAINPLTEKEEGKEKIVKCPLDKWAEIDKNFL
jgi:hypothetical protein